MHCRSCGADLPADAAYCSQCGARVELGSLLGVGTDLPASPTQAHDLSQTRELPRLDRARPAAAVPGPPRQQGPSSTYPVHPDPEPTHSRSSLLAMIATFAVLAIIGTFALTRLIGSDDPEPAAQSSPTPSSSLEESGDPAPSTSAASPAETPSSTPSTTPSTTPSSEVSPSASASIPADARRCSTSGNDAVATAYAGTERTSCEFAASVREAYRKAGSPAGATSLRAYSPVTKKWYSLSCDGGEPVRCVSTTNAIVILSP